MINLSIILIYKKGLMNKVIPLYNTTFTLNNGLDSWHNIMTLFGPYNRSYLVGKKSISYFKLYHPIPLLLNLKTSFHRKGLVLNKNTYLKSLRVIYSSILFGFEQQANMLSFDILSIKTIIHNLVSRAVKWTHLTPTQP